MYNVKEYFDGNNTFKKIENEPYSYQISKCKVYVFENTELMSFLDWYWVNQKESFLYDICAYIDIDLQWKYFKDRIPGFINDYPNSDFFEKNIIEPANMVELYENLININGINDFLNNLIIKKYKQIQIKKLNNIYYKFATNCLEQIFL